MLTGNLEKQNGTTVHSLTDSKLFRREDRRAETKCHDFIGGRVISYAEASYVTSSLNIAHCYLFIVLNLHMGNFIITHGRGKILILTL